MANPLTLPGGAVVAATPKAAMAKFRRARSALVLTQPFWGVLAMNLRPEISDVTQTMATDGESLFINAAFAMSLSDPELRGVIAHEVEHVARLHHTRRGRRDPRAWNEAADFAINGGLLAGGFKLPAGGLVDPQFRNMTAEAIFAKRAKDDAAKREQDKKQGQGAPQAGQGQAGQQGQAQQGQGQPTPGAGQSQGPATPEQGAPQRAPHGFGEVLDAPGGEAGKQQAEQKAEQNIRQAAMVAKGQGAGTLPGFIEEILKELDAPKVDWRARLRQFVDDSTIRELSWNRPNRRHQSDGFILPGTESCAPSHIVAIIDTSGSMDSRALAAIGGELQAVLDEGAAERITAVYCDTSVNNVESFGAGDVFTLHAKGRGGTLFAPAFKWVDDNAPDASAVVYFTDLDAYDWQAVREPSCPTLWAFTGTRASAPKVPFGEIVPLDPDA